MHESNSNKTLTRSSQFLEFCRCLLYQVPGNRWLRLLKPNVKFVLDLLTPTGKDVSYAGDRGFTRSVTALYIKTRILTPRAAFVRPKRSASCF